MSRDGRHNVCPSCLGVTAENRLAKLFKVRSQGEPVPTPAEMAEAAGHEREAAIAKTHAAIDKHLCPAQAPAPTPSPEPVAQVAGLDADLVREIADMRAAHELTMEQNEHLLRLTARLVDQGAQQTKHIAQMMQGMAALSEALSAVTRANAAPAPVQAAPEPVEEADIEVDVPRPIGRGSKTCPEIAARIKQLRDQHLSQARIAARIGCNQTTVSRVLRKLDVYVQ